jgi:Ca-activated chloride channel family protein
MPPSDPQFPGPPPPPESTGSEPMRPMTAAEAQAVVREYASTLEIDRDAPAEGLHRFLHMRFFDNPVPEPWRARLIAAAWVLLYGDDRHLRGWAHAALWGNIHSMFGEPTLLVQTWPPEPQAMSLMSAAMQTAPRDVRLALAQMLVDVAPTSDAALATLDELIGTDFEAGVGLDGVWTASALLRVPFRAGHAVLYLTDSVLAEDTDGEVRAAAWFTAARNPDKWGPGRARIEAAAADPGHHCHRLARDLLNRWAAKSATAPLPSVPRGWSLSARLRSFFNSSTADPTGNLSAPRVSNPPERGISPARTSGGVAMRTHILTAVLAAAALAGPALGQGLLIPTETSLPPLAIRSHKVDVAIDNQGAVTTVEQVFENNTERQLEARFVFPVPRGATLTKFTMLVNGVEKAGEIVEKGQARAIYNSIVQRSMDPGLLEYIGQDLLRANIFPIEPHSTQKITVKFGQVLGKESGLVHFTYPLKTSDKRGAAVRDAFSLNVTLKSAAPIKNVYSPSHSIVVSRTGEHEASVAFEQTGATLDKDFHLYYGVSGKDVGLNLLTYRPDKDKPGYFLMLLSPKSKRQAERLVQRDIVFVMDNSGSMAGEKMRQARDALKYCVGNLNDGDRFEIVKFGTDVEPWKNKLVGAADNRAAALKFIDAIEAEGGTNIDGAMKQALGYPRDPARPYVVVFFTDGKPTLGDTTDPKAIAKNVQTSLGAKADNVRIFTWGVGFDVDTHLLEQIAGLGHGVAEYVTPQEDIASKVAAFYEKAAHPVLTDLKLEVVGDKVALTDLYPKKLPDLYAGGQVVVFGRYTGDGQAALRLSGAVNGQAETFTFEGGFAAAEKDHGFIEPLWAKRRIGHLLDTIRLHGESKELVDDVIRLSKEYGIQTPYTSYLILEDGMQIPTAPGAGPGVAAAGARPGWAGRGNFEDRARRELQSGKGGAALPAEKADEQAAQKAEALEKRLAEVAKDFGGDKDRLAANTDPATKAATEAERNKANQLAQDLAKNGLKQADGRQGVNVAQYVNRLRQSNNVADEAGGQVLFKKAAGRKFFAYRGLWVDEAFEAEFALTQVKFGSEAYFKLLDKHPALTDVFRIGTALIVKTAAGKALMVSDAGEETLTDSQIADLFTAAAPASK